MTLENRFDSTFYKTTILKTRRDFEKLNIFDEWFTFKCCFINKTKSTKLISFRIMTMPVVFISEKYILHAGIDLKSACVTRFSVHINTR